MLDLFYLSLVETGFGAYIEYAVVKDYSKQRGDNPLENYKILKNILKRLKN